ncbi:MAG TPA: ribosomal protein S18-alanine N-acetyltransferase [Clostridiales bacterium]|jgi:ribosomal-protein-alanine N-acetyltransferase|nr:ribosomal protein S18-alanine N-acetyltransferase [Clostridiales bacterium]
MTQSNEKTEKFKIADASKEHIPAIEALEAACFSVPLSREMLLSQLGSQRHILLVAEEGGRVLGYVGMMYVLDEGYISNVAVDPACRRRGLATKLLRALIQRAGELKLSFVTLEVRASNGAARALYRKLGFNDVGRRKNYYQNPTEDAILMTLTL